jgi:hypothetical protein
MRRTAALLIAFCALAGRADGSTGEGLAPVGPAIGSGRIGAVLGVASSGSGAIVTQVLPGTPAERAGLQLLDTIVRVDGRVLAGQSLSEIVSRISGAPGTKVVLTVERMGRVVDLTITRASLAGRFNDVLRQPRVATIARALIQAQGSEQRVRAIQQVHLESADSTTRHYLDVSRAGYRALSCTSGGAVNVAGHDGRRAWGSTTSELVETARALMLRPYAALPSLLVAELRDPDLTVSYKGKSSLAAPDWIPFSVPKLVHRFEVGGRTLDFDPRSGLLVRHVDGAGYPAFYGAYRRVSGVAVPGQWTDGRNVRKLRQVSFAAIPAARFRPRGALHCDP